MADMDTLIREMHELKETVAANKGDNVLDWERVQAEFKGQIDALVETQVDDKLRAIPQRKGTPIAAYRVDSAIAHGELDLGKNKYAQAVREIAHEGKGKLGNTEVKAVDLWLAHKMLQGQVDAQRKGSVGHGRVARDPSEDLRYALKALVSDTAAIGDELVPTNMAGQLWDDIYLRSLIVPTMQQINMPSDPFDIPLGLGDVTWYVGTQNTAVTASDPATAKSTLTQTEIVTEQDWSYTLDEDAVVAMAPSIRARLAISAAEVIDAFALNADNDTASTNINSATPSATAYYNSAGQLGLRHQWLGDYTTMGTSVAGSSLSDEYLTTMLALMGKYAVNPSECVMLCDVATYLKGFLNLDGVVTLDKFGPNAVLLTGQLAAYRGIPIVVSASYALSSTDGTVDASGNSYGGVTAFNRLMWYAGLKRSLLIEVDRDIQKREYLMVTSLREAVAAHGTRSAATHTAGLYYIAVS